jgi:hypothetical protein
MSRAILIAWLPWFGWLLLAAVALWVTARLSGARLAPAKLRRLHSCEAGSVQTLSFVLTLPVFIMLVMFIVQVAELMVGIAVVHYAAFAAARAAIVWIPAEVPAANEPANAFYPGTLGLRSAGGAAWHSEERDNSSGEWSGLRKYLKIWSAAALACVPTSPARNYFPGDDEATPGAAAILAVYPSLAPAGVRYPRFARVIRRKVNYAAANTRIRILGLDRDLALGPTYNPNGVNPNEVGWEDPVTVSVFHYFALLPGPGRFLATRLSPPDGTPDTVSDKIVRPGDIQGFGFLNKNRYRQYVKAVPLSASVTLSNEGLKSVMPYAQPID